MRGAGRPVPAHRPGWTDNRVGGKSVTVRRNKSIDDGQEPSTRRCPSRALRLTASNGAEPLRPWRTVPRSGFGDRRPSRSLAQRGHRSLELQARAPTPPAPSSPAPALTTLSDTRHRDKPIITVSNDANTGFLRPINDRLRPQRRRRTHGQPGQPGTARSPRLRPGCGDSDSAVVRDELPVPPAAMGRRADRVVPTNLILAAAMITALVVGTSDGYCRCPLGAAGYEGSIVLVGLNGLRLLHAAPGPPSRPEPDPRTPQCRHPPSDTKGISLGGGPDLRPLAPRDEDGCCGNS
jgi:hypothetical protein